MCKKCHDAYVIDETGRKAFKLSDKAKELEWNGEDSKKVDAVRVKMNKIFDDANALEAQFNREYNEGGRAYYQKLMGMKQLPAMRVPELKKVEEVQGSLPF